MFSHGVWAQEKLDSLLDGLHRDAHEGNFQTYFAVERNWEGDGNTRWFDEILLNEKLGHCRGTGVVQLINGEWKIAHYALTMLVPNDIAADVGSQTREADKL